MKVKNLITFLGLLFFATQIFAQDLLQKVPAKSQLLLTLNNKVFFDNLKVDSLNKTLNKLKILDELLGAKSDGTSNSIEDSGIDLNRKAYMFYYGTDSVRYFGGLIPLANRKQFEELVLKDFKISVYKGVSSIKTLGDLRISWDDNTIYFLSGYPNDSYFENDEIIQKYGLLVNYQSADTLWEADEVMAMVEEVAVIDDVDNVVAMVEEVAITDDVDTMVAITDDYAIVDSILAQDEYADDYYTRYNEIYVHNRSIKDSLVRVWLLDEFTDIVNGVHAGYNSKLVKPLSNHTLVTLHVDDVSNLLFSSIPELADINYFGFPRSLFYSGINGELSLYDNIYGIKKYEGQIDIINNQLKTTAEVTFTDEVTKLYKDIYKKGVNPKFYKHLDKDVLAFASININSEAYLKNMPAIIDRFYGPLVPRYKEAITFGTLIFDVMFDDKAISKVFKGDNLLVLNGVSKAQVTYTDYEYDEDYNATAIERTKVETIPQFLWMFSSDDTRIYNQIIKLGLNEEEIIDLKNGIYQIKKSSRDLFNIYVQIKDGVVYVGNDLDKMNTIRENTFNTKPYAPFVSLIKKNVSTFVFNAPRIPGLLSELEIPISADYTTFVQDLSKFGEFKIFIPGFVGNKFKFESTLDFPKTSSNALLYIDNFINRLIDKGLID